MASREDPRSFRCVEELHPGEWEATIYMPSTWRKYGETWKSYNTRVGYREVWGLFDTEEEATAACDKAAREISKKEWDQAIREEKENEEAFKRWLAECAKAAARPEVRFRPIYWIKDSHNTPTSEPPKEIIRNIEDAIRSIEAKSQKQTHAWPLVGSVGDPTGVKAPTEQAGKITHMRNTYEEPTLQVKWAERQAISSDFVDPALMVYTGTEANDQDWRSGVICNGGKGTGDSFAADFVKQNHFKGLSQPGLAKTCAGMFHNLLNVELPMNGGWIESISRKLQKNWTMQFGGRGVQKNALVIFKMMLSMLLFDNFPAKVGAIAPEPAREGTLQAANSDSNASNFAFGIVAAIGVLFTIFQVLLSMKCWRRPSPVRTVERWCYEKVVEEEGV